MQLRTSFELDSVMEFGLKLTCELVNIRIVNVEYTLPRCVQSNCFFRSYIDNVR